jgi:ATP-dependent protease ClpP protease subunit
MFRKFLIGLSLLVSTLVSCDSKVVTLTANNFVSLIGPVSRNSVDDLIKSFNSKNILEYIQEEGKIILYINSPGGSVFAGNHLVQYIKTLQSQNISVDCVGQNFMSMGFVIMQSCSKRYAMFDSIGMQHQMSLGMKGNLENFKTHFNLIERVNAMLIDMEIKKIGITKEEYLENIISDWWSYGVENVENHIVDELINVRCTPSVMIERIKKKESLFGFEFEIDMSKCPILNDIKLSERNMSKYYDFDNYSINIKHILNEFKI